MQRETKTHEITVDVVIFTIQNGTLKVLLVQRSKEPFINKWAIPGGFVRLSENLDEAAKRRNTSEIAQDRERKAIEKIADDLFEKYHAD